MKISKRQLKRIIREEKRKLLEQGGHHGVGDPRDRVDNPEWYPPAGGEGDENLYVNLTDEQSEGLDELEALVGRLLDIGTQNADILDTVTSLVGAGGRTR